MDVAAKFTDMEAESKGDDSENALNSPDAEGPPKLKIANSDLDQSDGKDLSHLNTAGKGDHSQGTGTVANSAQIVDSTSQQTGSSWLATASTDTATEGGSNERTSPVVPPLLLKAAVRDSRNSSTPLGSPLTPDSTDLDNKGDGDGKTVRPRTSSRGDRSKRRYPPEYPGSPQTIVSERQQLAALKQQARSTEKQQSPDLSSTRERPSTPSGSSTSSSKEGREARNVNRRDGKGETPLHVACRKGDLPSIRKLLDDGADVNATDYAGWTPLHEAANHGREDVTKILVKNGADIRAKGGPKGITPLMDAVISGQVSVVKLLLRMGADPKVEDTDHQNCYHLVDTSEEIKSLLENFQEWVERPSQSGLFSGGVLTRRVRDDDGHKLSTEDTKVVVAKRESKPIQPPPKPHLTSFQSTGLLKDSKPNLWSESIIYGQKPIKPPDLSELAAGHSFLPVSYSSPQTGNTFATLGTPIGSPTHEATKSGAATPVGNESQYEDISDDDEPKAAPKVPQKPLASGPSDIPLVGKGSRPSVSVSSHETAQPQNLPADGPLSASVLAASPLSHTTSYQMNVPAFREKPSLKNPSSQPSNYPVSASGGGSATVQQFPASSPATGTIAQSLTMALPSATSFPAVNFRHQLSSSKAVPPVHPITSSSSVGPTSSKTYSYVTSTSSLTLPTLTADISTAAGSRQAGQNQPHHHPKIDVAPRPPVVAHPVSAVPAGGIPHSLPLHPNSPMKSETSSRIAPPGVPTSQPVPEISAAGNLSTVHNSPGLVAKTDTSRIAQTSSIAADKPVVAPPVHAASALPPSDTQSDSHPSESSASSAANQLIPSTALPQVQPPSMTNQSVDSMTLKKPSFVTVQSPQKPAPAKTPDPSPLQKAPLPDAPSISVASPLTQPAPTISLNVLTEKPVKIAANPPTMLATPTVLTSDTVASSAGPHLPQSSLTVRITSPAKPLTAAVRMGPLTLGIPPALPIPPISVAGPSTSRPVSPHRQDSVRFQVKDTNEKKSGSEKKSPEKEKWSQGKPAAQVPVGAPERIMLSIKKPHKKDLAVPGGSMVASDAGSRIQEAAAVMVAPVNEESGAKKQMPEEQAGTGTKKKDDSTRKPMTRQRAQALAAGHPKRKTTKDDKPVRPRGKRGTVGSVLIESPVDKDCPSTSAEPKQKKPRTGAKKLKNAKEEPIPPKLVVEPPQEPPRVESPVRLPFKKRITIRNEIEEFVNQRRQVEENWVKYTNNFPMKVFPKNCSDYLSMRKSYSLEASLPKKLDAPLVLVPELKTFFCEQEDERLNLVRQHLIERDRLIMGAEQEMMRLHQRFCRITAGITIPYSACMIISEQDSNRSFQCQDQDDKTRNATRNRISMRDLIKWLEESDDKYDYAKKEMLIRHRLEATMLRSKQRMDWAWKLDDLGMVDPSCRNPEDLDNPFVPEIVVEDFVMLPDQ